LTLRTWPITSSTVKSSAEQQKGKGPMTKGFIATVKPQSLAISIISVSVGTAVAALHGPIHWVHYFLTLLGISLLHAGSNVINDYFDFRNKIDTRKSLAVMPPRAGVLIQEWLRPKQVLGLALIFFALSLPIGIYLTVARGLPVFILGFIGFLTGMFYTAPSHRFQIRGYGEPAVFFIWGPLTVSGAYYVQTGQFSSQVLLISLPSASWSPSSSLPTTFAISGLMEV